MYQATSIRFQFHRRMWNKLTASSRCELLQEINELLNEIVNRTGGSYLIIIDPIAWHWWHIALSVDYNLLSTENKTNRHFLSMLLLWMYMYTYKKFIMYKTKGQKFKKNSMIRKFTYLFQGWIYSIVN